tara:strand:- start:451 stop:654 length:204 start_codon:yes stop_codon:yes gene_type:complete
MSERDLDYYLNYIYNNIDNFDYNKLIIIYNNLLFLFNENLLILKDIINKKKIDVNVVKKHLLEKKII